MAVFSNIILQKTRVSCRLVNIIPSSHVWNDRPSFTQKIYKVKGRFLQQNSTYDHLYLLKSKSRKVISNVAR